HHRAVPHLNADHARLRDADGGELIERHALAIGVDVDRVEQMRGGAARAQSIKFGLEHRERTLHAALQFVDVIIGHVPLPLVKALDGITEHRRALRATTNYPPTTVARPLPRRTASIAPAFAIENTMIGILFSRASAKAVASRTLRSRSNASR